MLVSKRVLQRINRDGNAGSPYEAEDSENWLPEASYTGKDCDSYASWKKRALLRIDWSLNEVMCIATCWTETREYHAVLLVFLDGTVYVLDNRSYWVVPIDHLQKKGYDFDRVPRYMQKMIGSSQNYKES